MEFWERMEFVEVEEVWESNDGMGVKKQGEKRLWGLCEEVYNF